MVDVIRADELSRLSVCADSRCEGLVLDLSRNRSRRFCSTTCANRNAVAAYRARGRRTAPPPRPDGRSPSEHVVRDHWRQPAPAVDILTRMEPVFDNPTGWVATHIGTYVASDGAKGHRFHGRDALLLTTRGRRSGKLRRTALYYGEDGGRYVVVGSDGGKRQDPAWCHNLAANPAAVVQVRRRGLRRGRAPGRRDRAAAPVGADGRDLPHLRRLREEGRVAVLPIVVLERREAIDGAPARVEP